MGGKTTSTSQSVQIPREVMDRYNAVNTRAEQAAQQPFQQYGGQFVAGLTPTQQAGVAGTSQAANLAQPYYQAATNLAMAGSEDVGPLTRGQIGYYMNPFTEAVANPTYQALRQQQGQELSQQQAQAIRSGAAFGDRSGIERANMMRQQALGTAQAMAPIYSQGYQQAVQTAAGQQSVAAQDLARRMQGGQQLAALGTGAQQAALQGAQAQLAAGPAEQQTQQADLTARYQQFLQERGYPFQVSQFLANIAMGTGALSGSTTTTTQPAGFFSDERLKKDAVRIGETDEGVPIYSYRYKGQNGPKQIGLMAQDVERVHPEAVGLAAAADGHYYKTVDYEKATERPRKEYGGGLSGADENWMGGAAQPESRGLAFSRGGYAPGGVVDPNDIQALLAAQRQSFGPFGQSGLYGGAGAGAGAPGGGGIVPEAKLPVPRLMTASGAPQQPRSGFQEAASMGRNISELYKTGKELRQGYSEISDWLSGKSAGKAYGGATGYADGGEIDPYEISADPLGDVVKAGKSEIRELPKPGQPPGAPKSGLGEVADLAKGAASLYSLGSSAASGLTALAAMLPFSDERMKDNVEPVGETYDGQTVYRYNLGDGPTQLGLMAQESREDAVHKDGLGLLHLDYKKATDNAAPFAYGGLVPRQGYQVGGEIADYSAEADLPAIGAQEVQQAQRQENPLVRSIRSTAEEIGINPVDLATAISYETGGTFDPWKRGPTTKWGQHRGLIQWGEPQRAQYGVTQDSTPEQQMAAVGQYLRDRGVKPGMGLLDVYSAINAGRVGRYGASDEKAGGAPGNVADKVASMGDHRARAARFLGIDPADLPASDSREVGPAKVPLGEAVSRGRPGEYAGVKARDASLGDFAREYLPSGFPTNEKLWVPALGFLGSMLASKSPFLGQAIGEGLMGGVSAYTGLEKGSADVKKTLAEAGREAASADLLKAQEAVARAGLQPFEFQRGYGWVLVDRSDPANPKIRRVYDQSGNAISDPNLTPQQVQQRVGKVEEAGAAAPAASSTATPAAGPGKFDPNKVVPKAVDESTFYSDRPIPGTRHVVTAIPEDYMPVDQSALSREIRERPAFAQGEYEKVIKQGEMSTAASKTLMQLDAMKRQFQSIPPGTLLTGSQYSPLVLETFKNAKALAQVFGGDLSVDINSAVSAAEYLQKEQFRLGAELQRGMGREPGFILQQMVGANPSITNTAQGFARINAGMEQAALYEKDKAEFLDNYYVKFGHVRGAEKLFKELNPVTKYVDRAIYYAIPDQDRERLKSYVAENRERFPNAVSQLIQQFDKTYGKGSAAIVVGSR